MAAVSIENSTERQPFQWKFVVCCFGGFFWKYWKFGKFGTFATGGREKRWYLTCLFLVRFSVTFRRIESDCCFCFHWMWPISTRYRGGKADQGEVNDSNSEKWWFSIEKMMIAIEKWLILKQNTGTTRIHPSWAVQNRFSSGFSSGVGLFLQICEIPFIIC